MITPARDWREGFPVGNGAVGATPFGRVHKETILLNHERLWHRGCVDELPDVSHLLPELRRLMAAKQYVKANDLYHDTLHALDYKAACAAHHPAGDLLVEMRNDHPFRGYERQLDFETANTWVTWLDGDVRFRRDCFVSRVNDVCVTRLCSESTGAIDTTLKLAPHDLKDAITQSGVLFTPDIDWQSTATADGRLELRARYTKENLQPSDDGREFGVVARVVNRGGAVSVHGDALRIVGADEVVVALKLYVYEPASTAVPRLTAELAGLEVDFDAMLAEHVAVHGEMYGRTRLDLETDTHDTPNEELLLRAYTDHAPLELVAKMANYGRYLLIGSSRPGGLPSNLQGIWNGDYAPAWDAFFMINENLQMNYWQALPGQIPETLLGVIDFYTSYLDDFRENARKLYGCRGIFIPSLMSPDTGLATHPGSWIINWISGAGWLAQHFYDYYLFTGDRVFLKDRAVPFLVEIAEFYEDFFYDNDQGETQICPSVSPENWPTIFNAPELYTPTSGGQPRITHNATMDVAIAKEVLTHLITSSRELGLYADRIDTWQSMIEKLPAYTTNEDGAVREWLDTEYDDNYHHRHQSHLYPVFPGWEVAESEQPDLYKAFKVAVDKRLVVGIKKQTGWSLSHMANINARLGDASSALECLDLLSRSCLGQNFFTYHNDFREMGITDSSLKFGRSAPFQIDANMGWTAAVYEMLLFSTPGELRLFPALPDRLCKGQITGLAARGGLVADLSWDMNNHAFSATLTAQRAYQGTAITPDGGTHQVDLQPGQSLTLGGKLTAQAAAD